MYIPWFYWGKTTEFWLFFPFFPLVLGFFSSTTRGYFRLWLTLLNLTRWNVFNSWFTFLGVGEWMILCFLDFGVNILGWCKENSSWYFCLQSELIPTYLLLRIQVLFWCRAQVSTVCSKTYRKHSCSYRRLGVEYNRLSLAAVRKTRKSREKLFFFVF